MLFDNDTFERLAILISGISIGFSLGIMLGPWIYDLDRCVPGQGIGLMIYPSGHSPASDPIFCKANGYGWQVGYPKELNK